MYRQTRSTLVMLGLGLLVTASVRGQDSLLRLFEKSGDVGPVAKPGHVEFDAASKTYRVTGGGENMWASADAFQFVWRQVSGDVLIAVDIRGRGTGGNAHRKACLLIRQSLDPDAPLSFA